MVSLSKISLIWVFCLHKNEKMSRKSHKIVLMKEKMRIANNEEKKESFMYGESFHESGRSCQHHNKKEYAKNNIDRLPHIKATRYESQKFPSDYSKC